jgi:hypothetical protein
MAQHSGIQIVAFGLLAVFCGVLYALVLIVLSAVLFWIVAFAFQLNPPKLVVTSAVTSLVCLGFAAALRQLPDRSRTGVSCAIALVGFVALQFTRSFGWGGEVFGQAGSIINLAPLPLFTSLWRSSPPNTSLERTREG